MRPNKQLFLATGLVAFSCVAAFCLSPSMAWAQTNAEETVRTALTKDEHGMYRAYDSMFVKWLPRFGDASAVALTKLLADKPIADADIQAILVVVRDSYDSPQNVEDSTERQPRTTLYLLRSLSQATRDPKVVASIDGTTAYVKEQYAAYLKSRPGE